MYNISPLWKDHILLSIIQSQAQITHSFNEKYLLNSCYASLKTAIKTDQEGKKNAVTLSALKSLSRPRSNSEELFVKISNGWTRSAFIIHGECDYETQKGNRKRKMFESLVIGRGQGLLDGHPRRSLNQIPSF